MIYHVGLLSPTDFLDTLLKDPAWQLSLGDEKGVLGYITLIRFCSISIGPLSQKKRNPAATATDIPIFLIVILSNIISNDYQ
jgi:hypothetical protein